MKAPFHLILETVLVSPSYATKGNNSPQAFIVNNKEAIARLLHEQEDHPYSVAQVTCQELAASYDQTLDHISEGLQSHSFLLSGIAARIEDCNKATPANFSLVESRLDTVTEFLTQVLIARQNSENVSYHEQFQGAIDALITGLTQSGIARLQKFQLASDLLREFVTSSAGKQERLAWHLLGYLLMVLNNPLEAETAFANAQCLFDPNNLSDKATAETYIDTLGQRAESQYEQGQIHEAYETGSDACSELRAELDRVVSPALEHDTFFAKARYAAVYEQDNEMQQCLRHCIAISPATYFAMFGDKDLRTRKPILVSLAYILWDEVVHDLTVCSRNLEAYKQYGHECLEAASLSEDKAITNALTACEAYEQTYLAAVEQYDFLAIATLQKNKTGHEVGMTLYEALRERLEQEQEIVAENRKGIQARRNDWQDSVLDNAKKQLTQAALVGKTLLTVVVLGALLAGFTFLGLGKLFQDGKLAGSPTLYSALFWTVVCGLVWFLLQRVFPGSDLAKIRERHEALLQLPENITQEANFEREEDPWQERAKVLNSVILQPFSSSALETH